MQNGVAAWISFGSGGTGGISGRDTCWISTGKVKKATLLFLLTSLLDLEPIEGLPSCGFGVMICNKALLGARAKAETRPEDDQR
jgi:hypothetical protein